MPWRKGCARVKWGGSSTKSDASAFIPADVDTRKFCPQCAQHGSETSILEAALDWLRRVDADRGSGLVGAGGSPGRSEREDSQELGTDCDEWQALEVFAESRGLIISDEWLDDTLIPRKGGNEHETYTDTAMPGWRFKVTAPKLALFSGRQRFPGVSPHSYFESWQLANIVFGDEVEFVGMIPTDEGYRLIIRQPEVEAADPDNPHPTKPEINAWLRTMGFEYDEGAWVREADGVVLTDEHEGNFILTDTGVYPIDLHLRRLKGARGEVIRWEDHPAVREG